MTELYLQMRDWWGSFDNGTTKISALLETEILRVGDGTPSTTPPYIIFELGEQNFNNQVRLQARIFSRIIGNPGFVAPVLSVQDQFRERLKNNPHIFKTSKGGVVMRYLGTSPIPLPADETRQGWMCGAMQYSLTHF